MRVALDRSEECRWHALRSCVIALARVNLSPPLGSPNQTSRVALRTLVKPESEREREREGGTSYDSQSLNESNFHLLIAAFSLRSQTGFIRVRSV